ncbi:hypothetical protein [Dryocola sp. BD613]|uniref:hypothetical protein n=1 Tax=Dryocola sp. BD613 TaxID=3133272 RepID=UPI003F4FCD6B
MKRYQLAIFPLFFSLALAAVLTTYFLWQRYYERQFSCEAHFVQHFPDETLVLWLSYRFGETGGMLSMHGYSQNDAEKKFNRKILFSIQRKDNIYHLHSEKNLKFPDDKVDDSWLDKYEPAFFVYPDKNIYTQIHKQQNGNYLFMFSTLPTYVCLSRQKG